MIPNISKRIVSYWIKNKVIDRELECVYIYGIELILSSILGFSIVFVLSLLFFDIFTSFLFLITFVPIRQYCGGYHADTYIKCNATLACIFTIVAFCAKYIQVSFISILLTGIIGGVIFCFFCPVENKYKPIDEVQRKKCKSIALAFLIINMIVCAALHLMGLYWYRIILFTIISVCCLVIIGIIKNRKEVKLNEDNF